MIPITISYFTKQAAQRKGSTLPLSLKTPWQIIGIGDFNHDGIDDLFTYDPSTGKVDIAYLDGTGKVTGTQWLAKVCGPSDGCSAAWKPAGMADVDNDATSQPLFPILVRSRRAARPCSTSMITTIMLPPNRPRQNRMVQES